MSNTRARRLPLLFTLLPVTAALLIFAAAAFGSADISLRDSSGIILNRLIPGLGWEYPASMEVIVLQIRLPRIILSFLVGMGLAASGTVFQGVFRNPMADPYILGVSSGAAFGVTLVMVTGLANLPGSAVSLPAAALAGGLLATLLVLGVAGRPGENSMIPLLLAGIAVSFLLSAGISLLMYLNRDKVEAIVFWTFGSFAAAGWDKIACVTPMILGGSGLLLFFSRDLDLLTLGEETAATLGLNVRRARLFLLVTATFIAASAVMVSGIIGFVGLIIPHAVRLISGPRHRVLLPGAILTGALFCVASDTLARTILSPAEIPVGIITSLVGAPYFLYLLRRRAGGLG